MPLSTVSKAAHFNINFFKQEPRAVNLESQVIAINLGFSQSDPKPTPDQPSPPSPHPLDSTGDLDSSESLGLGLSDDPLGSFGSFGDLELSDNDSPDPSGDPANNILFSDDSFNLSSEDPDLDTGGTGGTEGFASSSEEVTPKHSPHTTKLDWMADCVLVITAPCPPIIGQISAALTRGTPIILSPSESGLFLLGEDYPLYSNDLSPEGVRKMVTWEKVVAAHHYLKQRATGMISMEKFLEEIPRPV